LGVVSSPISILQLIFFIKIHNSSYVFDNIKVFEYRYNYVINNNTYVIRIIIKVMFIYYYNIIYYMNQIIEFNNKKSKQLLVKMIQKPKDLCSKFVLLVQNENRRIIYGVKV